MNRTSAAIVLLLMAASFGVGRWRVGAVVAGPPASKSQNAILYYTCPMHPDYRSDKPGKAPCCGMTLTPVYARDTPRPSSTSPSNRIVLSAEQQQLIGVKIATAERAEGLGVFRTTGRVVPDEARVYRLTAKVDGWVRRIYPDSTGALVKKGQPLLAVYAKEFQVAQQAYLFALNQMDRFRKGDEPDALERLKQAIVDASLNLENLGVSADQIATIARDKKILPEVDLVAPATGIIQSRNVYADERFDRGMDFYRIVDLSRVWVVADISDPLAQHIRREAGARVSTPQLPGAAFHAGIPAVQPQFDAAARALQMRLEAANPAFALTPDMYVDVEFPVRAPAGVVVPREAIVDSGLSKVVFVDCGGGTFEPRRVQTGWTLGDRVEVAEGLSAGERIVTSGTFLIDSESRLRNPGATRAAASGEPL